MSQASGGARPPLERSTSVAISSTQNAATAFGEDFADDSYSVSELSHYNDDRKKKQSKRKSSQSQDASFAKTVLSKLNREESVQQDSQPDSGIENGDEDKQRRTSTSSPDHSDEVGATSLESEDSDVTLSSYMSFAQTKFQMKALATHTCSALPQPLLPKHDKADYLASLASWVTILRIMGDLPDIDTGDALTVVGSSAPITAKVKTAFKNKYTKKEVEEAHKKYSELFKDPIGTDTKTIPFLPNKPDTMLEKVQLICAMGIYKPGLRDELYCQICKQLTNNPSKNSTVRGWVLLTLFAGSFSPSEKFAPSLNSFLKDGPSEFAEKVDRLLRRTCSAGTRSYPPSWLEFQAAKNGKPLLVPITFMSGHRMLCEVDSAMTVQEVVRHISERLGLQEYAGYSLYIALHTKISCLGHGSHRILDAVSECEQHTKQMGMRESAATWRIFFRREFFTPWLNADEDPIDIDLVYQQVKRGVTMGEYRIDKDDTLVDLTSKFYYVEYPDDLAYYNLPTFITSFVPENLVERRPKDFYVEKIRKVFEEGKLGTEKPSINSVKATIVKYAKENFFILFSRYYDVPKVIGPNLQISEVVVGVNSKGIYVVDNSDTLRLRVEFCEIMDVSRTRHHLTLGVANMDDFVFSTSHSDDFYNMISTCLEELKKRSTLAIAQQDITQLDGAADSTIVKGDVLELSQSLDDLGEVEQVTVLCTRTKKPADVPVKLLYMLATVEKPSDQMMDRLTTQIRKNASGYVSDENRPQATLQQYARHNFRPSNESAMTKFLSKASIKKKDSDALWSYSKDPIKKPLLKRTNNREDIKKLACISFSTIQTYMSNLVINEDSTNYNLCATWILDPARRNKYLREEIYCQIVKQLTNNPDTVIQTVADRGWALLTLLTSLTPPSNELMYHVLAFLKGSTHPLARQCEKNLKANKGRGGNRIYPSHILEHEMVSKQQPNVRVQVFLPSQEIQTLEVTSNTRIFDMKKEVATRLRLKTFNEYSLFLTAKEKVHCLSDRAYYFDCLSQGEAFWFKSGRRDSIANSKQTVTPALVMLKKIWVNSQPGIDPVADKTFHYPQELPNYLRAYHQIPETIVTKLASFVYIAKFGTDESKLADFEAIKSQILPKGYIDNKSVPAVQQDIRQKLQENWALSPDQAKTAFIQELSRLATYGSVFCECKQRHAKGIPKNCLMAVNYNGVHVIDGNTKEILRTIKYDAIPNWAFDDASFTLIVSEGSGTSKILFETTVGHNMDDLLMSYVAWIMNYQMRKKYGVLGDDAGESIC